MYGSDQAASLIPSELSEMVRAIRERSRLAVGNGCSAADFAAELVNAKKLRYWSHISGDRELTRKATFTG